MKLPQSFLEALQRFALNLHAYLETYKTTPVQPVTPPQATQQPDVPPRAVLAPAAPYDWSTPVAARHSLRVIADEEGLTVEQKNDLSQTMHCESGYNIHTVHPNLNKHGLVTSTDYGICQINDFYHIGPGKDFPSVEYVLENPEAAVRFACKMWKAGKADLWVCHSSGLCKRYTP